MQLDLESIIRIMAKSYRFNFTVVQPPFSGLEEFDNGLRKTLDPNFDFAAFGKALWEKTPLTTFVLTADEFNCGYGIIRPRADSPVYLLGPVVRVRMTDEVKKGS